MNRQADARSSLARSTLPLLPFARRCRQEGGRALLVGGMVRDELRAQEGHLSGNPSRQPDFDVEVHGLPPDRLERILRALGPVDAVGRAFAVFKTCFGPHPADVAIPRRDSRQGPGHRGIRVEGDPHMGVREAARRRDLTINAIAFDPLEERIIDPFDGHGDIRARRLRAVDGRTFGEDPLRALRVVQFAARFEYRPDPTLESLCARMPLHELPAERIRWELQKLLLRAARPSVGFALAHRLRLWQPVLPPFQALPPEKTGHRLDEAASLRDARDVDPPRAEALMLAVLLYACDLARREPLLDRLAVHRWHGFHVRRAALFLADAVDDLRPPPEAPSTPPPDGRLRILAAGAAPHGGLELLVMLALAVRPGPHLEGVLSRVDRLGVARTAPSPRVQGRDLVAAGIPPGPQVGRLLKALYELQLREGIERASDLLRRVPELLPEEEEDP